jgi:glutamyl-tRNA reductase
VVSIDLIRFRGGFKQVVCVIRAAPHVILTREKLAPLLRARRHRPVFMIDLAIPRDIDPDVHNLDGVYLYDLDALQSMAERTLMMRRQEAENCHRLIEQHVLDFQLWIERTQPLVHCFI